MSIQVMSAVWECALDYRGDRLLILLALADYSNPDGISWPSIQSLAHKARSSDRWVQLTLRDFESSGVITKLTDGGGRGHSARYQLNLDALKGEKGEVAARRAKGAKGEFQKGAKGEVSAERVNSGASPLYDARAEPSLEPSIIEPSNEPAAAAIVESSVLKLLCEKFENSFHALKGQDEADILRDWAERIPEPRAQEIIDYIFREAAMNGSKSLIYLERILDRLQAADWPVDMSPEPRGEDRRRRYRNDVGDQDEIDWLKHQFEAGQARKKVKA